MQTNLLVNSSIEKCGILVFDIFFILEIQLRFGRATGNPFAFFGHFSGQVSGGSDLLLLSICLWDSALRGELLRRYEFVDTPHFRVDFWER